MNNESGSNLESDITPALRPGAWVQLSDGTAGTVLKHKWGVLDVRIAEDRVRRVRTAGLRFIATSSIITSEEPQSQGN